MRKRLLRKRLLGRVRSRLERFEVDRNPATVLDPEALAEVAALVNTVSDPAADLEIAQVAGRLYWARYLVLDPGEDQQDLTAALALFAQVYQTRPDAIPDQVRALFDENSPSELDTAQAWTGRAVALVRETMRTGNRSALNDAIDLFRQAVDATPLDHPDRVGYLSNLGAALRIRFERGGVLADLDGAITAGQAAVDTTPADHPTRAMYLSNLGIALRTRFERAGALADLDGAIVAGQAAVDATPGDHPDRAGRLSNLGIALQTRSGRGGGLADLDDAIDLFRQAADTTPADHPDRAGRLSNLGVALRRRFERGGELADLDSAITAGQAAVDATPADHPDRAMYLSNLGIALRRRFERRGELADLDSAIVAGQAAVDATPADHPDRAGRLSNLGLTLQTRFERGGVRADLDSAIVAGQAAVDATPTDHPDHAGRLSNLGIALRTRSGRSGESADLDSAIGLFRQAADATPADHPDRTAILSNLGTALQTRFERAGELVDLDDAIVAGQAAVDATPTDHPDHAGILSNLGVALRTRFERAGNLADADAAIAAGQAAVDATPADHPDRAGRLSNLGNALRTRFERAGDIAGLDGAIGLFQRAADASPADHPNRALYLSNLGVALRTRFERAGNLADAADSIAAGQAAVDATPVDHPDRAGWLSNLGIALRTRFERGGNLADLNAEIDAHQAAVRVVGASPRVRVGAARGWARAAADAGRWDEAVTGFAAAIELLGQVAPRVLGRGDQEYLLAEVGSLGADAAACCVRAGLVGQAVELFEQGRGVMLGQALDTRTDLTILAERHPDLAASFTGLRDALDRANDPARPTRHQLSEGGAAATATGAERRATAVAFDDLIARIRELDGFAGFLRPPPVGELLATAADGPVVVVAVSRFGSHALLLTGGGVEAVPLAGLTPQTVYDQVNAFLTALDDTTSAAQGRVGEILGWLWDVLAGPVLDRLGIVGPTTDGGRWPRLWWCTSGLLSFLPVHAAGHHHTRFDPAPATVLDRVIPSYTPTIRALAHTRHTGRPRADSRVALREDGRLVAVAMPHTPDAPDLPGALAETSALQARFPGQVDVLTGPEATRQTVLDRLPAGRWAHFACHGAAELADPSTSRLLLADQPLTVLDVARLQLHDAELAFLSACSTAMPGSRLTDEAIHLASAFQLAGYRHVIAALWPIGDQHAVNIAHDIYTTLTDSGDTAAAVHTAARGSRSLWARMPAVWASHIHVGA